jgi:hypothetical protein
MTEQHTEPHSTQMIHSHFRTYDRVEMPAGGESPDLNGYIKGYLAAGWAMAFYSAVSTETGFVHHFIWRGPEPLNT